MAQGSAPPGGCVVDVVDDGGGAVVVDDDSTGADEVLLELPGPPGLVVVVGAVVLDDDDEGAGVDRVLLELLGLPGLVVVVVVVMVVVERPGFGRVLVVVLVVCVGVSEGVGQLDGTGAECATNRPGSSRPTVPPKRRQYRRVPLVMTTARLRCFCSSSVMPMARPMILRRFPWRMMICSGSSRRSFGDVFRKRNSVPRGFTDQPGEGAFRRAHSFVPGFPMSTRAPLTLGSSLPPGSGAESAARATTTRRSVFFPWRSASVEPGSSSTSCAAARFTDASMIERSVAIRRCTIVRPTVHGPLGASIASPRRGAHLRGTPLAPWNRLSVLT